MHRFLGAALAPGRRDRVGHAAPEPVPDAPAGAELELLRKAHWAIEKVTGELDGALRLQHRDRRRDGAGQRVLPRCAREVGAGALRFAAATAASLIFPFAPHTGADAYELLTGARVWEEPWPTADPALLAREEFELVCQVNGRVRDRVMAPHRGERRGARRARAGGARTCVAHIDGKEIVKVVVVPGKLVNIVVR